MANILLRWYSSIWKLPCLFILLFYKWQRDMCNFLTNSPNGFVHLHLCICVSFCIWRLAIHSGLWQVTEGYLIFFWPTHSIDLSTCEFVYLYICVFEGCLFILVSDKWQRVICNFFWQIHSMDLCICIFVYLYMCVFVYLCLWRLPIHSGLWQVAEGNLWFF